MNEALKRFGVTRSLKDRVFLGVLGLLFGVPAGCMILLRFTRLRMERNVWEQPFGWILVESFIVIFLFSVCAVIWAAAAPQWLQKSFVRNVLCFLTLALVTGFVLLGIARCATFHAS